MPRKVLFASDTSGHTAGYQTVLAGLRDGGFEVVSIGHAEPEHVAETALQEGVDAVAYRVMDRDAAVLGKSLLRELSRRDLEALPVVMGGIVRREIRTKLVELAPEPGNASEGIVSPLFSCLDKAAFLVPVLAWRSKEEVR